MVTKNKSIIIIQNVVLIFIAAFMACLIFILDLYTGSTIAVASMYIMVILYSWLLPGKYASIYAAAICTILTILAALQSKDLTIDPQELSRMNLVISLAVIWIGVTMISIAKSSFAGLEQTNKQLLEKSVALLETIKELDNKQQELAEHKMRLENLNTDLIIKNRELERFTSIASHDLQEPLRTIGNMTQLITRKYNNQLDDQGKKILNYVSTASNRLTTMIKGLLEFSRIGKKHEIELVDCKVLLNNIIMDLDASLKAVNASIKIHDLPDIKGNAVALRMLFQNLISNGLKFHKAGVAPIIEVSAKNNNTHVEFCINDNGIGIDKEDYERIFLIYQRLHPVEEYEGTGLGLAYCRKIVELHGGKIWINSTKGLGSTFYFTIAKNL
ncbi:MAG TPA: ATP-binding protein [Cyclobacteriaceae bacterium]|nr:ATP-binding protein [Cyclobacteriaceae bacterium]